MAWVDVSPSTIQS